MQARPLKFCGMTIERMRELRLARPFKPFAIRLRDGRRITIRRGDGFALSPAGHRIVVMEPRYQSIELESISDITFPKTSRLRRKR